MPNKTGTCALLMELGGYITTGMQRQTVAALDISSALVGTLTIYGVVQSNGTPQPWVISPGTSGQVAVPGSGHTGGNPLSYQLSNLADSGKVIVACLPG